MVAMACAQIPRMSLSKRDVNGIRPNGRNQSLLRKLKWHISYAINLVIPSHSGAHGTVVRLSILSDRTNDVWHAKEWSS